MTIFWTFSPVGVSCVSWGPTEVTTAVTSPLAGVSTSKMEEMSSKS